MNEYFKRKSSEWNISDFLEECGIEEFKQKIEVYLTSLKTIANTQQDKRSERAQERTLSPCVIQVFETSYEANNGQPGPDYKLARDWEKNHNKPAKVGVHLNNSTITAINSNIGSESYIGGTVNARALLRKLPQKRKSANKSQAEPDEKSLNPAKMWTLESSGRIVEKIIYEHARTLKHESHLHSFILNDVDKKAQSLFRKEEWEEIFSLNLKVVPKIDKSITELMKKYSIDLIRGEGSSMASSDRKNDDTDCEEDRKKIGRKGDGVFRLNGDRLEFGAIEAGKKWEGKNGKKYITDSLKLSKMLRDMLVQLAKECNNDEQIVRKLQTVGMLHSANRFQLLTLDAPKGYICRIRRFDFHEVASHINNPPLAFVLKDILRAKAIIKQTLELVQEKKSDLDDLDDFDDDGREVNRSERCTTPPTITLNKTHKTPEKKT
ncbi:11710_t:CDS:2, partial [Dentiscutata heterogama]